MKSNSMAGRAFIIAALTMALTACGNPDVSFNTLEQARNQARDNAVYNAQRFRATDPRFKDLDIIARGDSTQAPNCPQGDGWASIDFVTPGTTQMLKAKCSTVSGALMCMTDADFKNKSFANEEGHCAPLSKVPFPLPKIAQ